MILVYYDRPFKTGLKIEMTKRKSRSNALNNEQRENDSFIPKRARSYLHSKPTPDDTTISTAASTEYSDMPEPRKEHVNRVFFRTDGDSLYFLELHICPLSEESRAFLRTNISPEKANSHITDTNIVFLIYLFDAILTDINIKFTPSDLEDKLRMIIIDIFQLQPETIISFLLTPSFKNQKTILWNMARYALTRPILKQLIDAPYFLDRLISHPDFLNLLLMPSDDPDPSYRFFYHSSIFFWLTYDEIGQSILEKLMSNPTFFNQLIEHRNFIPALLALTPQSSGSFPNQSALNLLKSAPSPNFILQKLRTSPALKKYLDPEDQINDDSIECDTHIIDLFTTNSSSGAPNLLNWASGLFGKPIDPDLLQSDFLKQLITHRDFLSTLLEIYPNPIHPEDNITIFFLLAGSTQGREILNICIKDETFYYQLIEHPNFISALLTNYRMLFLYGSEKFECKISTLHLLAKQTPDINLLEKLFTTPEVIEKLFHHDEKFIQVLLQIANAKKYHYATRSALYYILKNINLSWAFLNSFTIGSEQAIHFKNKLHHHPSFLSTLLAKIPIESEGDKCLSVFYWLCRNTIECKIFDDDIVNQIILSSTFLPALLNCTSKVYGQDQNTSALYYLMNPAKMAFFDSISNPKEFIVDLINHLDFNKTYLARTDTKPAASVQINLLQLLNLHNSFIDALYNAYQDKETLKIQKDLSTPDENEDDEASKLSEIKEDIPGLDESETNKTPEEFNHPTPLAGITQKYIARLPRLPIPAHHVTTLPTAQFNHQLTLVELNHYVPQKMIEPTLLPIQFTDGDNLDVNLSLYTCNPQIELLDKVLFIFAGRKKHAFIPPLDANIRTILVIPEVDFEEIKSTLQPGVDCLVIHKLCSPSHGHYENTAIINSRRIAAFIAAMHFRNKYHIPYALMADDNLESLHFISDQPAASWEDFVDILSKQFVEHTTVCISLATISNNRIRREQHGELGCKLFLFDINVMYQKLGNNPAHWFVPFFPSKANGFWGQDYYFQIVFHELFKTNQRHGYHILNSQKFGLKRNSASALTRHVAQRVTMLCETSFHTLFTENQIAFLHSIPAADKQIPHCIDAAILCFQKIIHNNIEIYQKKLSAIHKTSLIAVHAHANGINFEEDSISLIQPQSLFLTSMAKEINLLKNDPQLRLYQQKILNDIASHIEQGRVYGQINLATGTGKTYIQFYLAIAALLSGTTDPIMIVTPHKQLVKQAYGDFIKALDQYSRAIHPSQIIQIDSDQNAVSIELLKNNISLNGQPCIFIICLESYIKILESEDVTLSNYRYPAVVLIDECHLIPKKWLQQLQTSIEYIPQQFIVELSATPPELNATEKYFTINYSRDQAVKDNMLPPCILDRFDMTFINENLQALINNMPQFLTEHIAPNDTTLLKQKGIIYVPNNYAGKNYSLELYNILTTAGIDCFQINSSEENTRNNLEEYKRYKTCTSPTKIIICKEMAKVGFSDPGVDYIIYLQNGTDADFCQAAGRAMRINPKNPHKIAYIVAFKDVKTSLVFQNTQVTADEKALQSPYCKEGVYSELRKKQHGLIRMLAHANHPFSMSSVEFLEHQEEKDPLIQRNSYRLENAIIERELTSNDASTLMATAHTKSAPLGFFTKGMLPPKDSSYRINIAYEYTSEDIQAIMAARLAPLIQSGKTIHVLASSNMDANTNGNRVKDILHAFLTANSFDRSIEQHIIIPIHKGRHWIGIALHYHPVEGRMTGLYFNSLHNDQDKFLIKDISFEIQSVYSQFITLHYASRSLRQNDSYSCGAYLIENIYCSLTKEFSSPDQTTDFAKKFREHHCEVLESYRPDYLKSFLEAQRQPNTQQTLGNIYMRCK